MQSYSRELAHFDSLAANAIRQPRTNAIVSSRDTTEAGVTCGNLQAGLYRVQRTNHMAPSIVAWS